ncbi:hypothetical protein [Streptosporangium sp. NBC_01469]|uniref:hypothetical protein n=1 Tax=Streptosporangium sp. NBC_01469 TaxID=2903898 RepID=UPI002E2BFFAC|nr:hypothetical protein [Streptosporangium sp. NBC_01469]
MSPPPVEAATGTTEHLPAPLSYEPEEEDTVALALRFADWCLWYGEATERWWALSPTWCRERVGLVEADTSAELAARIRHIEDFRPHLIPDRHQRPRHPLSRAEQHPTARPEVLGGSVRVAGSDESTMGITGKGGDRDGRAAPVRTRRRVR